MRRTTKHPPPNRESVALAGPDQHCNTDIGHMDLPGSEPQRSATQCEEKRRADPNCEYMSSNNEHDKWTMIVNG
ncbi:unnamed protein product [Heligmosomoides polygyrus]|uniref:Uncharacterized protein n=1 Tax=Heligmosomoides polygyrus TaxID=6339 RepID=A0A183FGV4_HELPZ|nr:unnamed protein product [Heligmosomoides polygyrus]